MVKEKLVMGKYQKEEQDQEEHQVNKERLPKKDHKQGLMYEVLKK